MFKVLKNPAVKRDFLLSESQIPLIILIAQIKLCYLCVEDS